MFRILIEKWNTMSKIRLIKPNILCREHVNVVVVKASPISEMN